MTISDSVDITRLAFPDLARVRPEEEIAEELKNDCKRAIGLQGVNFEKGSIPGTLLRVFAGREITLRHRVNQAAQAVMLATAGGTDLDHVAAFFGVRRMEVEPADRGASPPREAVRETDERLRFRARLALESLSQAGTKGAYLFAALSAHPHLKDVSVYTSGARTAKAPGEVKVRVLSIHGNGLQGQLKGDDDVRNEVEQAILQVRAMTDTIDVQWARIHQFDITASIALLPDTERRSVAATIRTAVQEVARRHHRLGKTIRADEFLAAMYQHGVARVELASPNREQAIDLDTAPWVDPRRISVTPSHPYRLEVSSKILLDADKSAE